MAAKEILPTIHAVATAIWGPQCLRALVLCHCANQAAVTAVSGRDCKDPTLAHMLWCFFFLEAKLDMMLTARHTPGRSRILKTKRYLYYCMNYTSYDLVFV